MKKPLTKSVIKNEDVEEKPIDDDTKVLSQHGELKIPLQRYNFSLYNGQNQPFKEFFLNEDSDGPMGGEKITKKNWFLAVLGLIVQPLVHTFEIVI